MSAKMTDEEKRAKGEATDLLIKHVFDNLRNVVICVTIALAGSAIIRYRTELPFGSTINLIIGLLVIAAAIFLFWWNMVHGVEKLIRPIKGTRKSWIFIPVAAVYMFSILAILQASIMDKSKYQANDGERISAKARSN